MRALLDLMRENEASVQESAAAFHQMLKESVEKLTILDPLVGEEDLSQAVTVALATCACYRH